MRHIIYAIDSKFHKKLGVGFKQIHPIACRTNQKGSHQGGVRLLNPNPIEVNFEGPATTFILYPRVIEDLYSHLNVSNLYLKSVNANMANTMQKAILTILDESTELILKVW